MKTISTIKSSEIAKRIERSSYYDLMSFNASARRFCKALNEGRLIATVTKVSASGMRRNIRIAEMAKGNNGYFIMNFNQFLSVLGYHVNDNCEVVISGCGMDMIYHITSSVIGALNYLGILNKKEYQKLVSKNANVI